MFAFKITNFSQEKIFSKGDLYTTNSPKLGFDRSNRTY